MLESEADIPSGFTKPLEDLGHHLSLCQALAMARRKGTALAVFKRDMWCFEPVIGLGFQEAPPDFLAGRNRYPETAQTLEAGRNWAKAFPRLPAGRYRGIAIAPLASVDFQPEIVIVYCDTHQLTALLIAVEWIDGRSVMPKMSGHAACVNSIVPIMQGQRFNVTSPCYGDISIAMAESNEMIFSMGSGETAKLLEGLAYLQGTENGVPVSHLMAYEFPMLQSYVKLGVEIGMDWLRGES
jgi:uncharacterized protein (DUF169 family)